MVADEGSSILRLFKQIQLQLVEEIKDLDNTILMGTNSNSEALENEKQEEQNEEQAKIKMDKSKVKIKEFLKKIENFTDFEEYVSSKG